MNMNNKLMLRNSASQRQYYEKSAQYSDQVSLQLTRFACWPRKIAVEPALTEQNPQPFSGLDDQQQANVA